MSLLVKHNVPFFEFFKRAAGCFFSPRFWRKNVFSFSVMALLAPMSMFVVQKSFGADGVTEISVNPYLASFVLIVFFCLCVSTMVQTHFAVTGRTDERKHFGGLTFGKTELKYAGMFFLTVLCGGASSAFWIVLVVAGAHYFFSFAIPPSLSVSFFLLLLPYFMIRVVCLFPATVFGEKLSVAAAWKMTAGIGGPLVLMYVSSAVFPLFATGIVTVIPSLIQGAGGTAALLIASFLYAWLTFFMLWASGVAQASFMGDFYLWLKENDLTDGFSDSFVFSVAKKKERD